MAVRMALPTCIFRRRAAAAAFACLMVAAILPLPAPASGGPPPFGIGDWTVTGPEILEDQPLLLDGNLVIQSGGSLAISNSSLTVYCKSSGEHGIRVMAGGTLKILNGSMVNSLGEWNTFNFQIDSGAIADFENSTFITCGARLSGILSRTDMLSIRNCSFLSAFYALTLSGAATVVSSRFVENQYAVLIDSGSVDFVNCSFDRNGFAAWPTWSDASFINCTFTENSIGIFSDVSACHISSCNFTGNIAAAVYAQVWPPLSYPSSLFLQDCVFEANGIGISHLAEGENRHNLSIKNCDFLNCSRYALDWENPVAGSTTPHFALWTATKDNRVVNSKSRYNGQITVEKGGNLTLWNSNLSLDNVINGENNIEVKSGGRLALETGSVIKAFNPSFPYGLRCRPGSSFCMNGSLLRDCGWDLAAPNTSGPLLETGNVSIISSTVDFNPAALVFNGSKGAVIERSSIRGMERGLELDSSSVALRNSTLTAISGNAAKLSNDSLLDCLNSVLDRRKLEFKDAPSRANFSWLVDVRAVWADGRPVEGANITIQDANGAVVNKTVTDADGYVRGEILIETSLQRDAAVNLTPHLFNCTRGSIWNRTVLTVNNSQEIMLVLTDDQPPAINITYPSDGISLDTGSVILAGTARDNMGLDRIEVVLDGRSRQTVFLSGGSEVEAASWNTSFMLDDGYHFFEAAATDLSGNSASAFASIWVDTVSPRIRIASPQEGQLTNLSLLTVSGFMEPGAMVYICGTEAKTGRDMFSGSITLSEGQNTITATALDAAGNTNSSTVTVRLDSTPPMLGVESPLDGLRTRSPTVEVSGSMEPGSEVYVNGRQVARGADPGVFRTAISLTKEVTTVTVDAIDPAGNHNVTTRKVVLDTVPPFLKLNSPAEGLVTNGSSILVTGEAEAGALLSVGGVLQQLPGSAPSRANFSAPIDLREGQNTILVTARDFAGNQNTSTVHVTLDTIAPPLTIDSPADGASTANSTIFIEGSTEPGVLLAINGQEVPVGRTGSFSMELRLSQGSNAISVRATDAAGNSHELSIKVTRATAEGESLVTTGAGPDWPFALFLAISTAAMAGEGWWFSRRPGRRAKAAEKGAKGGA